MGVEENVSEIREFFKIFGKKIIEGNFIDVMRISRPVKLSSPYTYHHFISLDWMYCEFLNQAAKSSDPVKRLQLATAFVIEGLHNAVVASGGRGPLNPVLGETLYAKKSDGTSLYCE